MQDRIKQTNLEKYGVDNPFKNKEKILPIILYLRIFLGFHDYYTDNLISFP